MSIKLNVAVTAIDWDVFDHEMTRDEQDETKSVLPKTENMTIELSTQDLEEKVADALSDKHGFCVNGFQFEITGFAEKPEGSMGNPAETKNEVGTVDDVTKGVTDLVDALEDDEDDEDHMQDIEWLKQITDDEKTAVLKRARVLLANPPSPATGDFREVTTHYELQDAILDALWEWLDGKDIANEGKEAQS
ncbi:MAG: hypothetical protein IJU61_00215 [Victivallales bacterium]|nr:hypothetical protein [Victivallales bacterium]